MYHLSLTLKTPLLVLLQDLTEKLAVGAKE